MMSVAPCRPRYSIVVRFLRAAAFPILCLLATPAAAQPKSQTGEWAPAPATELLPFGSVHMALLPGGTSFHSRIVVWGEGDIHEGAEIGWNPDVTGCGAWPYDLEVLSPSWDPQAAIFCAGHAQLATTGGGLLTVGGDDDGATLEIWGIPDALVFAPGSGTGPGAWTVRTDMQQARFYGSLTGLRDGRMLAAGGLRYEQEWYFGGRVDGDPPPTDGTGDYLHRLGLGTKRIWDDPVTPLEMNPGDRPNPREGHTAVRLERSGNSATPEFFHTLFGGKSASGVTSDNGVYLLHRENGGTLAADYTYRWSKLVVSGPVLPLARSDHAAVDLGGFPSQMVIYGGMNKPSVGATPVVLDDFWKLSFDAFSSQWVWTALPTSGGPGARYGHAAAYSAGKMFVFGGSGTFGDVPTDGNVYEFTFSTGQWRELPVAAEPRPGPRRDHTLLLAGSVLLLYGGSSDVVPSSSALWKLDLTASPAVWSEISTTGPSPGPRANHSASYEVLGTGPRMTIFGGEAPTATDPTPDNRAYAINPFPGAGSATWVQGPVAPYRLSGQTVVRDPFGILHARIPEIYDPSADTWVPQTDSGWLPLFDTIGDYPVQFVVPGTSLPGGGGRLLRVGRDPVSRYLDIPAAGIAGTWQTVPYGDNGSFKPLTGVQYRPGKLLVVGGTPTVVGDDRALTFDANSIATATWVERPGMALRVDPNILMLPNGKVMVLGDIPCPQIWNPVDSLWTAASPCELDEDPEPRGYHSTAMLLPDARVISDGPAGKMRVYCPPYLFNGDELATRPTITAAPASVVYGEWFVVGKPVADQIGSICLIRPAAVTHSFDQNGRYVPLTTFEVLPGGAGLRVLAPMSGSVAPPGDYLLFILNSNGVPSVARWVHLGNCDPVPCDTDSPPVTSDLIPDLVGPNEVWLAWTAPGDDTAPLAGVYDLRIAGTPVSSESAYEFAGMITDEPPVAAAGTPMTYTKYGLAECTQYSFALKTRDGRGNWSLRSNAATVTTTCGGGPGGGYSAGRTREEGAEGESVSNTVSTGGAVGSSPGSVTRSGGTGMALLAGATSQSAAAGELVAETRREAAGGWEVTVRRVSEAEGLDASLAGGIVSQVRGEAGGWKTLGRHSSSPGPSPLGLCALREDGRVVLPTGYGIERVAGALRVDGEDLALAHARHSRLGALDAVQLANGGGEVDLAVGDALTLSYAPGGEQRQGATSWYLLVRAAELVARSVTTSHRLPETALPTSFALHANQPNPTRVATTIRFDLPVAGPITLEVFDPQGRRIVTLAQGEHAAGHHAYEWNLRDTGGAPVRSGLYLCRFTAGAFQAQRKVSVLP